MYNTISDPVRQKAIESIIEYGQPRVSDVFQVSTDTDYRPTTHVLAPILSSTSSPAVLGIVAYTFSWDTLFTDVLAHQFQDITIVLSTKTSLCTYTISGNKITILKGDSHDSKFDYLRVTLNLTTIFGINDNNYNIVAYPTEAMHRSFLTENPRNAAIIVITTAMSLVLLAAFLYVYVKQKKREHELVVRSEAESQFTNFLAHEVISTSANTVISSSCITPVIVLD
jgi:CHASE domain